MNADEILDVFEMSMNESEDGDVTCQELVFLAML